MEKVLILDNYDSFTYNLAHYVESNANFEAAIFRNNEISLEEVNSYKTIILSPGPGLPKDSGILKDLIKNWDRQNLPKTWDRQNLPVPIDLPVIGIITFSLLFP